MISKFLMLSNVNAREFPLCNCDEAGHISVENQYGGGNRCFPRNKFFSLAILTIKSSSHQFSAIKKRRECAAASVLNWVRHPIVFCRCRHRLCRRFWCHVQRLLHWLKTIRNHVLLHSCAKRRPVHGNRLALSSLNCLAPVSMMHGSSYWSQLWSALLSWSPCCRLW